jgi:predicted site-specific integrase-resolvase
MAEVCAIAHLSRVTIQRRVKAGRFPAPIDRGREAIFDRKAVYGALGIALEAGNHATPETPDPWLAAANALAAG